LASPSASPSPSLSASPGSSVGTGAPVGIAAGAGGGASAEQLSYGSAAGGVAALLSVSVLAGLARRAQAGAAARARGAKAYIDNPMRSKRPQPPRTAAAPPPPPPGKAPVFAFVDYTGAAAAAPARPPQTLPRRRSRGQLAEV